MTSRLAVAAYAAIAYGAFVISTLWAIGFLAGRGAPTSVDGPAAVSFWASIAVDAGLLLAFAVQHSVMARAGFKRRLTRLIPESAERSTYVLAASLLLCATFWWWRPVPTVVWSLGGPWSAALWVAYALGWVIAVSSTFMIDHAEFLGLKQAYGYLRRLGSSSPEFTQRWLYAWCRHPLMLGLLIVFWATPHMTVGHLFFAVASTAYIAVGVRFEERDLRANLGAQYEEYASRVPAIVPSRRRALSAGRLDQRLKDPVVGGHLRVPLHTDRE